jgi:hypothetical protein
MALCEIGRQRLYTDHGEGIIAFRLETEPLPVARVKALNQKANSAH